MMIGLNVGEAKGEKGVKESPRVVEAVHSNRKLRKKSRF